MAWLKDLLKRGKDHEIEDVEEEAQPAPPRRPPLMLLLSDASGMAALRMLTFDSAEDASEYVEFWYPEHSAGTIFAVWALPGEPDSRWMAEREHRGEAVILVRDEQREGVVYPFSFTDLNIAWAFLRQEMEKDLELSRVSIYWAVPIDIKVDGMGKVQMHPDAPPPLAAFEINEGPSDALAQAIEVVEAAYDEPADEASAAATEFALESDPAVDEDVRSAAEEMFADDADDAPVTAKEPSGDPFGVPYHEFREIAVEAGLTHTNGTNGKASGSQKRKRKKPAPSEASPQAAAEKESGGNAMKFHNGKDRAVMSANSNGNGHSSANGHQTGEHDIEDQLRRLLEGRRIDRKDGPFKGFNSPPGRF